MKLFSKKYNERAQRIERYILKNKLFLIIATVLVVFLIGTSLKPDTQKPEETVTEVEEVTAESDDEPLHWRFYSIDLWILLVGGGFCSAMIVKERRKAKEKLN